MTRHTHVHPARHARTHSYTHTHTHAHPCDSYTNRTYARPRSHTTSLPCTHTHEAEHTAAPIRVPSRTLLHATSPPPLLSSLFAPPHFLTFAFALVSAAFVARMRARNSSGSTWLSAGAENIAPLDLEDAGPPVPGLRAEPIPMLSVKESLFPWAWVSGLKEREESARRDDRADRPVGMRPGVGCLPETRGLLRAEEGAIPSPSPLGVGMREDICRRGVELVPARLVLPDGGRTLDDIEARQFVPGVGLLSSLSEI